jgi:type I restriction enzyme S subunit
MSTALNGKANDWSRVALDTVCERRIEQRDPRRDPERPFFYVDISSVNNLTKTIESPKQLLGREAPSRARQVIRTGDVLIATTRPNLNAVALVPPELDGQVASTGFCVLRPTAQINSEYLFLFVQAEEFVQNLSEIVKGALYPAVTDSQVRAQRILLPPVVEQQAVAVRLREQLAEVARARAAVKAQLESLDRLPSALLADVFQRNSDRV